jgi:hypothetical protein
LITPQSLHIGESALKMKKSTTKRPPAVGWELFKYTYIYMYIKHTNLYT